MSGMSSDEIRQLVREALRELVPSGKARSTAGGVTLLSRLRTAVADSSRSVVEVRLDNAQELTAFAHDILQAPDDVRAGILSGTVTFSLLHSGTAADGAAGATPRRAHQIAKGVVTETMITEIGRTNDRLIIGKGVVVTPLARDRAREVKLEIVRDRT